MLLSLNELVSQVWSKGIPTFRRMGTGGKGNIPFSTYTWNTSMDLLCRIQDFP